MNEQEVEAQIKAYILKEFLPGENPEALTETTPLSTSGILDSIAVLKVVGFLESHFGISLQAYETGVENFNTVADITRLVMSKAC